MRISSILARKMRKGASTKGARKSYARPVVRIATAGVALGIALIIISTAIVSGFQSEIKNLVVGFNSHIQLVPENPENPSVLIDEAHKASILQIEGVDRVSNLHIGAGLLETKNTVKGVTIKGTCDTVMIAGALTDGSLPIEYTDIILSKELSNRLEVEIGDRLSIYLVENREKVKQRSVKVCGLYDTGLLEYDEKFIYVTPELLQKSSSSGVQALIELKDSKALGKVVGLNEVREKPPGWWTPHHPNLETDTSTSFMWVAGGTASSDTAYLNYTAGMWEVQQGSGSDLLFSNGYEIFIDDIEQLYSIENKIYGTLPYDTPNRLSTFNIKSQSRDIFNWLDMLDINVIVIICLMILISIINMVSALLITILEKRPEVGMLKSLGMRDSTVMMTFVNYSARIIFTGFLAGNILGFAICLAQTYTGIITLDPAAYYISEVPVEIDLALIAIIEIIAFTCCLIAMFLPALYSLSINPSTALRIKE